VPGLPVCERGTGIFAWDLPGNPTNGPARAIRAKAGASV